MSTYTDPKANMKIIKARAGLIIDEPFFGALALKLRVIEDTSCKTMWTDGYWMGYSPEFVNNLSLDEVKGVIAHEVMHCACAHHARRGNRNNHQWNIAGDYAINDILVKAKFTLPKGALFGQFQNMSAEDIYNKLPKENSNNQNSSGQNGNSSNSGDPGNCGEVRDAKSPDTESGKNKPSKPNKNQKRKLSESEARAAEDDWKIATQQAAQSARMQGKLPAGIDRMIDELVNPKVDWREILQKFIDNAARNDYSWQRPNRRYLSQGITVPSLYSIELGKIVIAVDTSGSIDLPELRTFASEISGILKDYDCEITVMYCDTQVYEDHIETWKSDDLPLTMKPMGGGGTDFRPVFDYINTNFEIQPTCLIYFTDAWCNSLPEEPDYPVLWACTEKGYSDEFGFGEIIKITDF